MDSDLIQKDFPILQKNSLVYLDSAASSLTPVPVLEAVDEYYRDYRANTHRGLYREAQRATKEYETARKKVADFIGAEPEEIIFTSGATASSNMLVSVLAQSISFVEQDQIVTTIMEHHALFLPLQKLAGEKKLKLEVAGINGTFLDIEDFKKRITDKTKIVGVILASNVLGTINDVKEIIDEAHAVGAIVIVDGTAAVGHMEVNVKKLDADFLFFSGHKMCGPTGIGVLYGKCELSETLEPSVVGGGIIEDVTEESASWSENPGRFEAGTQNIAGAIGLGRAVEYLTSVGMRDIRNHVEKLTQYAQERLGTVKGVRMFSAPPEKNIGIVSFSVDGIHPHDVAEVVARNNVALRAGHHCALLLHKKLGIPATVRASFYFYNDKQDVDALVTSIEEVKRVFNL